MPYAASDVDAVRTGSRCRRETAACEPAATPGREIARAVVPDPDGNEPVRFRPTPWRHALGNRSAARNIPPEHLMLLEHHPNVQAIGQDPIR